MCYGDVSVDAKCLCSCCDLFIEYNVACTAWCGHRRDLGTSDCFAMYGRCGVVVRITCALLMSVRYRHAFVDVRARVYACVPCAHPCSMAPGAAAIVQGSRGKRGDLARPVLCSLCSILSRHYSICRVSQVHVVVVVKWCVVSSWYHITRVSGAFLCGLGDDGFLFMLGVFHV